MSEHGNHEIVISYYCRQKQVIPSLNTLLKSV